MRVTLIYSPDMLLPTAPYGSLAVLPACLEAAGHEVSVRDLNLETFHALMRREKLLHYRERFVEHMRALDGKATLDEAEATELARLQRVLATPVEIFDEVEESIAVMKDPERFYEPALCNRALDVLRASQRFIHAVAPPPPHQLCPNLASVESLFAPDRNDPFIQEFENGILSSILDEEPDVVGFTLPFQSAIYNALKLIRMLKQRRPDLPVILGGGALEVYQLDRNPELFRLYDYAMIGEGDEAFVQFLEAIEKGEGIDAVPNINYLDASGELRVNPPAIVHDLNTLPTPDYGKVPLSEYLLPSAIATFHTSRGCYYGKCTFCSDIFRRNYRMRRESIIIEDLVAIHEATGIRHFHLWDALAPPRTLLHISKEIQARGLELYWMAETKFEKQYSWPRFIQTLAEGGGRFLQFGFESSSERVLSLIDKGNDLEIVDHTLERMKEHGIQAGVTFFIGFPTETQEEAEGSFDFIAARRDRIKLASYTGTCEIGSDTILYEQREEFGIEIFVNDEGRLDYRYEDGTGHWDFTKHDAAFTSRGDFDLLKNNFQLVYAAAAPDRMIELTGFHRLGPMSRHVDLGLHRDLELVRTPEGTIVRYDRHPFRNGAGSGGNGGRPAPVAYAYHIITGAVYEVDDTMTSMWDALAEPISVSALCAKLGHDLEDFRGMLEEAIDKGFVRVLASEDRIRFQAGGARLRALQSLVS